MYATYGAPTCRQYAAGAMQTQSMLAVTWALLACIIWPDETPMQAEHERQIFDKAIHSGIVFG